MTLDDLNACDRETFVKSIGWVFEHSPWVAERTSAHRPFATLGGLFAAMTAEVERAGRDEQLALLRAHPDLGTRAEMSAASTTEQSSAGLTALDPAMLTRLKALNAAYRRAFDFPFLFAVKNATIHDVLTALETRLGRSADEEFEEARRQAGRIAWLRLQEIVNGT